MMDSYWKTYAEICEKQIKQLNNYISLLLEEKRRAQGFFFAMGLALGVLLSYLVGVMK